MYGPEYLSLTPLLLGEERIYYASRPGSGGFNLRAFDLHSGHELYETPLVAAIAPQEFFSMRSDQRKFIVDLVQTKHGEVIIQLDSDRVFSTSLTQPTHFTIIDGASGQVIQKISYEGLLGRCVVANINLSTFALVDKDFRQVSDPGRLGLPVLGGYQPDKVFLSRIFSQQPDKTFSRTAVKVICLDSAEPAIHPLATHAYSLPDYNGPPNIITLSRVQVSHAPTTFEGANVDGFYYTYGYCEQITLARRENKKNGKSHKGKAGDYDRRRREFPETEGRWGHDSSIELVDGGRVLIRRNIYKEDDVFLLNFTQ
jgi:hypothetical protein